MTRRRASTTATLALLGALACQQPPSGQVHAQVQESDDAQRERRREFERQAHAEAMLRLREDVLASLVAADPIAAATIDHGELHLAPVGLAERRALLDHFDPVWKSASEIDESLLPASEVIVLRAIRFALGRMHEDLDDRPRVRSEPLIAIAAVEELLATIEARLLSGGSGSESCRGCAAALGELGSVLPSAALQIAEASPKQTEAARLRTLALIERIDALAERPLIAEVEGLGPALAGARAALDTHARELETLGTKLPDAEVGMWVSSGSGLRVGGLRRLPDLLGERALGRMLAVEEQLVLPPARLWALARTHVDRWVALRRELVGEPTLEDLPRPIDLARCEATLTRLREGLATIPEVSSPPTLDCSRWLALHGDAARSEAELTLALLDAALIEPQREALRKQELPTLALIRGQWSGEVHRHLRRVMLLARLDEPAARARALDEGRRALCLAAAGLWIHARLGPADEAVWALGSGCSDLGEAAEVEARVLADPRAALTGLGLALIGDEPAAMVGFDRYWWAPLGLMRLLATPPGMHPDEFTLPSEQASAPAEATKPTVELVELDPSTPAL